MSDLPQRDAVLPEERESLVVGWRRRRRARRVWGVAWALIWVGVWACFLTAIGVWLFQPTWWGIGIAGRHEVELHAADDGLTLVSSSGRALGIIAHAPVGHWFLFGERGSGWANPMMQEWAHQQGKMSDRYWRGTGWAADGSHASWVGMDSQLAVAWSGVPAIGVMVVSAVRRRVDVRRVRRGAAPSGTR
jgi:hypothetical protein